MTSRRAGFLRMALLTGAAGAGANVPCNMAPRRAFKVLERAKKADRIRGCDLTLIAVDEWPTIAAIVDELDEIPW